MNAAGKGTHADCLIADVIQDLDRRSRPMGPERLSLMEPEDVNYTYELVAAHIRVGRALYEENPGLWDRLYMQELIRDLSTGK